MFKKADTSKKPSCLILILLLNSLGCVLGSNLTAPTISPTEPPTTQAIEPTPISGIETQWPALEGTPIPISETPITAENVQHITRSARWGKGILNEEIAWSPDSRLIAGGSDIGIYIYDVRVQPDSHHIQQETGFIEAGHPRHITFSPDGKLLAAAVDDVYAVLWHVADGRTQAIFSEQREIASLAFSPDGKLLAAGMQDGSIKLWEISSGQERYTRLEHTGIVNELAFSPDGQMLASAQDDKIIVWQTGPGQSYRAFTGFDSPIRDLDFSAAGEIAALSGANDVKAWQIETAHPISLAFQPETPNGTDGIFYSVDGQLQAWYIYSGLHQVDVVNNVEIAHYDYLIKGAVYQSAFSPDMRLFAMTIGGAIWIKNLAENTSDTFLHAGAENGPVLLSPDGKLVVEKQVELYHHAEIWDVTCGCRLHDSVGETNAGTNQIGFTPNGMLALVNGGQGQLTLLDIASGQTHQTFEPSSITAFAFSPDGQTVAIYAGFKNTELSFWSVSDGQKLGSLPINVSGLAYSPNGELLAVSSNAGAVQLLRTKDGFSQVMTMPYDNMNAGHFDALTFSPDGSMLLGKTNELLIGWEVSIGRVAYALPGCRHTHLEGIFSSDGEMFVYPTTENTVVFLNTRTGQKLHEIPADTRNVAFSSDGKFLVVAARDGTIQIWGIH